MPEEKPGCCLDKEARGSQELTQASSCGTGGLIRDTGRARDLGMCPPALGIKLMWGLESRCRGSKPARGLATRAFSALGSGEDKWESPHLEDAGKSQKGHRCWHCFSFRCPGSICSLDTWPRKKRSWRSNQLIRKFQGKHQVGIPEP